jgi:hypothetical protein
MKILKILTVAIAIFSFSACTQGQYRKSVHGNGNVVTKERTVENFTGIKVSTGIDVYLKQGDNEKVSVEADENLQDYILTEVKNGVLHVYTETNIREAERKRVYVTMKEVRSVSTSSAGDIYGETPIKGDKIDITASSAGNIKLELTAKEIKVDISSSGDMDLKGEADILDADLSSAGDLKAYDLAVREANVSVSSAGDADINVSEKLIARASSAGDINYKGNPKNVDIHASSAGGVHKR